MDYEELKKLVLKKIEEYPETKEKALRELSRAKIAYEAGFNIVDYLKTLKDMGDLEDSYIIPFFLNLTDKYDLSKPIEIRQIYPGDSGGLDIDTDLSTAGKPLVKEYLESKYGKDRVLSIGTYGTVGMKSAIKDILRKEGVPFANSNKFCSEIDDELSFEENMEKYKQSFPDLYAIYSKHSVWLNMVPHLSNMIRSIGKHAGGVLILDKPIWESVPIVRAQGEIASAFVENGASTDLDNLGFTKYDLLGITQLDVIDQTIDMINEELYEIEENGIIKIVPKSYLENLGVEI